VDRFAISSSFKGGAMEAGYDYLLAPGRVKRKIFGLTGILLSVLGLVLLAGGGGYYLYAAIARSQLDQLNTTLPAGVSVAPGPAQQGASPESEASAPIEIAPPPGIPLSAIASQAITHGESPLVDAWTDPRSYEPLDYRREVLLRGFTPLEVDQAAPMGSLPAATRLIVPDLGIDSGVTELAIQNLGDSRSYETPVNAVGHIPEAANAGEAGSSWFFAHLESPIVGEGSVFYNLPRIPEMLEKGQEVFVIADTGEQQYLYLVTATEVFHQDEMRLYNNGWASIHLVSCVPRLVYDHRLVVTGELVGIK
jgi:sortase (surface protein transpeptidase)